MELEEIYRIDRDRLSQYYERIKNQDTQIRAIENVAKFLIHQSIGSSFDEVHKILEYFKDKIDEDKEVLDLAFEWIRAQKIRLEYKKYLVRAQYPYNDLSLAVDDCLYRFFLDYDDYIRQLFKKDVREHNFCALYEIFFSPFDKKTMNIQDIVEKHIHNIPTHYCGSKKINTRIITLREGLSIIIVKDYENVLFSRKEESQSNKKAAHIQNGSPCDAAQEFNGTNLERIIKTLCFNKLGIHINVIESAISNFLNSYFKFGTFYTIADFKDLMIKNLGEYIYSGLTERIKNSNPIDSLTHYLSKPIEDFCSMNQNNRLDGSAWVNDLKPVLTKILKKFCENLFQ